MSRSNFILGLFLGIFIGALIALVLGLAGLNLDIATVIGGVITFVMVIVSISYLERRDYDKKKEADEDA